MNCYTWWLTGWGVGFIIVLLVSFNVVYLDHQTRKPIFRDTEDYLNAFMLSVFWPFAIVFGIAALLIMGIGKVLIYVITIPSRLYKSGQQK
jgi:hypothetical protein